MTGAHPHGAEELCETDLAQASGEPVTVQPFTRQDVGARLAAFPARDQAPLIEGHTDSVIAGRLGYLIAESGILKQEGESK